MSWLDENHAVALTSVVTVRSGLSSFWLILKVVQPTRVKQVRNNGIKFFMVLTKNNKIKHLSCQVYNLLFLYIKNRFQRVTLLISNAFFTNTRKAGSLCVPIPFSSWHNVVACSMAILCNKHKDSSVPSIFCHALKSLKDYLALRSRNNRLRQ